MCVNSPLLSSLNGSQSLPSLPSQSDWADGLVILENGSSSTENTSTRSPLYARWHAETERNASAVYRCTEAPYEMFHYSSKMGDIYKIPLTLAALSELKKFDVCYSIKDYENDKKACM
ncbi:jg6207 [Pararge aegeria aegeria]|uniref:Jg6207 protein n=1 Tax=Pararge aegeria aegeria TaxID=348720 RepID=A0A8S4RP12_9NEOP|nr:jg6207 [Pararge aegeria aegeria]